MEEETRKNRGERWEDKDGVWVSGHALTTQAGVVE